MAFTARYAGKCSACGAPFLAGTMVESNPERPSTYRHVECPDERPAAPVCSACFLVKPCPCDDDQAAA